MVVEYAKPSALRVLVGPETDPDSGVEQVDFDTLLTQSDVITIHVHLTEQTRGLISRQAFSR